MSRSAQPIIYSVYRIRHDRPPDLAPGIWIMTGLGLPQDGTLDEPFHDPRLLESALALELRTADSHHYQALSQLTPCLSRVLILHPRTPMPDPGLSTTESTAQVLSQLVSYGELGQQEAISSRFPVCILVDHGGCYRQ
jgi:hypothetical protein